MSESAKFSVKGLRVNILGVMSHIILVTAINCYNIVKAERNGCGCIPITLVMTAGWFWPVNCSSESEDTTGSFVAQSV